MSFRDLNIDFSYETGNDDPVNDFYTPVLVESIEYDRIAGYFSSSSLAISARGIAGLIKNGGKMRIISSPNLSKEDIEIINSSKKNRIDYCEKKMLLELDSIEDEFERDHIRALGWLLSNKLLELKIAFVIDDYREINSKALFHQKIGILKDNNGNYLSFSGSINETASGWLNNIEEFKVFKSWISGQDDYLNKDREKFESIWNNKRENLKVEFATYAIKSKMINMSKDFDVEKFVAKNYIVSRRIKKIEEKLNLFLYQKNAVELWKNNNYKLLFEMATGTGKTRTAIGCINELNKQSGKLLCIVSCPQGTLSLQWRKEIDAIGVEFDKSSIIDGTNKKWRVDLKNIINKIEIGYLNKTILYTTHATCSNKDFIELVSGANSFKILFVGDEAHGLGAIKSKNGLLEIYDYRIGLSATPKRWFDDIGTKKIVEYFGNKSFEFTIGDALSTINPLTGKTFLVNYMYLPVFVELDEDELFQYEKLSSKISKLSSYSNDSKEFQEKYESLLFMRSNIVKNAYEKYNALVNTLKEIGEVYGTLIFTSPQQMDETMKIIRELNISAHRYTQKQGVRRLSKFGGMSERQYLIEKFKQGMYKALVSIKCLDEGIDIPSANTAILMANSSNPREYIQRIGRVIRQSENKNRAYIYDFIVEPCIQRLKSKEMKEFEIRIFSKELERIEDMSRNAINNAEVLGLINSKLRSVMNGIK